MQIKRNDYDIIFEQQIGFIKKSCDAYDTGDESEGIRIAGHLRTLLHDSELKEDFNSKSIKNIEKLLLDCNKINIKNGDIREDFKRKLNAIKDRLTKPKITSKSLFAQLGLTNIKFLDTKSENNGSFQNFHGSISNTVITYQPYYGLIYKESQDFQIKQIGTYHPFCHRKNNRALNNNFIKFFDWRNGIIYNENNTSLRRKDLILKIANLDGYAHIDDTIDGEYQEFKESEFLDYFINNKKKETTNLATLASVRQIAFELIESLKNAGIIKE